MDQTFNTPYKLSGSDGRWSFWDRA